MNCNATHLLQLRQYSLETLQSRSPEEFKSLIARASRRFYSQKDLDKAYEEEKRICNLSDNDFLYERLAVKFNGRGNYFNKPAVSFDKKVKNSTKTQEVIGTVIWQPDIYKAA